MDQVLIGVFSSWRDGHDALRALQLAGLSRDDAHLYRAGKESCDLDAFPPPVHDEDDAEYVAHGEHQGVVGARNRFLQRDMSMPQSASTQIANSDVHERTLLVIRVSAEIRQAAVRSLLHEHGAVAVKDATGHWRFSPYRKPAGV